MFGCKEPCDRTIQYIALKVLLIYLIRGKSFIYQAYKIPNLVLIIVAVIFNIYGNNLFFSRLRAIKE